MKKRILICLTSSMFILSICPAINNSSYDFSINTASSIDSTVLPKKDIIGYQYKKVNNIIYRRLYNFSANKPVGDWERI